MKIRIFIKGLLGYVPFILKPFKRGTGGSLSARYCYSVWLRHLSLLKESGMRKLPKTVAEIGPGDSLGVGLNALITGSNKYFAFDIIEHANPAKNLEIFDELLELYKNKTPIPGDGEFPKIKPKLKNYDFPTHILSDDYLANHLAKERIVKIRDAIMSKTNKDITIKYIVPWDNKLSIVPETIDLIFSQAVMEHVIDVYDSYKIMYSWLKYGGFMSHEIDYTAHETHDKWYGHWTYPNWLWKIILNGRSYAINRYPNSYHIKLLIDNGFKILFQIPYKNIKAKSIHKSMSKEIKFEDNDLTTSSCYIITQKK